MIPDPRNPNPSPESVVLDILGFKPRLTTKELYEFFLKKYEPGMTIQGFYKLLRQLISSRILVKEGGLISIDVSWIHNLTTYVTTLNQTYHATGPASANILLNEGESKTFAFEKVIEMDNFWMHALITILHYYHDHPHRDGNVYNYNHHSWYQLVRVSSERALGEVYRQMGQQWYLVSGSYSYLDTLVAQTLDIDDFHYAQTESGAPVKENYYVVVIGDFITETSLPNYIYELMESMYQNITTISEFNAQEFFSLINQPGRTHLTIERNKKRAEKLRERIKQFFKKPRKSSK